MFLTIFGWTEIELKSQIFQNLENLEQYFTNKNMNLNVGKTQIINVTY